MSRNARSSVALPARRLAKALVLITLLASACASPLPAQMAKESLPPAQIAKNLNQIVGTWEGGGVGPGSDGTLYTLTISETGRYRAVNAQGREFAGQVQVSEGRFRFKSATTGLSGTMTLYEGEGKRILGTRTDDGRITAEYRAAKP
jgi:hypothetical protein